MEPRCVWRRPKNALRPMWSPLPLSTTDFASRITPEMSASTWKRVSGNTSPQAATSSPTSSMRRRRRGLYSPSTSYVTLARRSQLRLYYAACLPLASLSSLTSASDNAHTRFIPHDDFGSQLARALQLSRLFENREGIGAAYHQRLHHGHCPVRGISGKMQAHPANRSPHRRARFPAAAFLQSSRWPQRRAKTLGAAS